MVFIYDKGVYSIIVAREASKTTSFFVIVNVLSIPLMENG
jgi:hypothetical protein